MSNQQPPVFQYSPSGVISIPTGATHPGKINIGYVNPAQLRSFAGYPLPPEAIGSDDAELELTSLPTCGQTLYKFEGWVSGQIGIDLVDYVETTDAAIQTEGREALKHVAIYTTNASTATYIKMKWGGDQ